MTETKKKIKTFSIFPLLLSVTTHNGLKKIAKENGRTITSTINLLVKKYLDGKITL